jgi:hypothetical protein
MRHSIIMAVAVVLGGSALAAQHTHASHAAMNARGAEAMGFDQARAAHHFILTPGGGDIEVQANDASDADTRAKIQAHLETISQQFKDGNFASPIETHAELPPGAADMIRLRSDIDYTFHALPAGGRVSIAARGAGALDAVHAFLRYQIQEHRTGDPLTVRR